MFRIVFDKILDKDDQVKIFATVAQSKILNQARNLAWMHWILAGNGSSDSNLNMLARCLNQFFNPKDDLSVTKISIIWKYLSHDVQQRVLKFSTHRNVDVNVQLGTFIGQCGDALIKKAFAISEPRPDTQDYISSAPGPTRTLQTMRR